MEPITDLVRPSNLKMLMGRWWTEGNELSVVLNESAVRAMGLQDPVGSIIRMPWWSDFSVIKEYEIVGVVNDFHALSFRESIHPMLFIPSGGLVNNLYIRVIRARKETSPTISRSYCPR